MLAIATAIAARLDLDRRQTGGHHGGRSWTGIADPEEVEAVVADAHLSGCPNPLAREWQTHEGPFTLQLRYEPTSGACALTARISQ